MWRSVLAVCLLVLAGVFTVSGTGTAVTTSSQVAAVQTESLAPGGSIELAPAAPGPVVDAPQEPTPEKSAETRRKLWLGGIAVLLFALVYWRNKKRWSKWRAGRKKG
ncbi:hypothetical protein [Saccharothrix sp. NRRL B-16314]|uniref:hypothetical protein n=1 Tax=Saccharothrix sp. NRRL B-16314 TaxID=1463825 RepID=UPI0012DE7487|nr:hypothetical protein [Saccharothrix sp. NRRL B-16314]